MIILFFLSSGLFLGWSLGANDAANIFGTAVGTRMLRFKTAAIIGSIFVVIGAVVQGAGASHTLGKLGSVSTIAAAFTVALSAALTVYWMTRMKLPVSTSQAIVGAIIGWNFYTDNPTDITVLTKIVSTWISGPILGGIFAVILFIIVKMIINKTKVHLLYKDIYIRYGLVLVGAFGAYSLGANNIANVMGVFTNAIHLPVINIGGFQIDSTQQLFFVGGIAIAVGIITYSHKVMETVGNTLMPLTPEAAIVIVLSQALVLFIFSSQSLSNFIQTVGLPAIPLVPVSSSQIVIGSIIGIGIYKGGKQIKYNILGSISLGWIATPIVAGILSFFMLFFVNNVFRQDVGNNGIISIKPNLSVLYTTAKSNDALAINSNDLNTDIQTIRKDSQTKSNNSKQIYYILLIFVITALIITIIVMLLKQKKVKIRLNNELAKANDLYEEFKNKTEQLEKYIENKKL